MTVEVPSNEMLVENSVEIATGSTSAAPKLNHRPRLGCALETVEFSFLDNKNICCGVCGEIVPYDTLMCDHLPNCHPELLAEDSPLVEELPYEVWLQEKLQKEKLSIENGFKMCSYRSATRVPRASEFRQQGEVRRVSSIRVNPREMTLVQLDQALRKKMFEKMGRQVPVSLIDKLHARCGLCNSIISLNKKFEIVHLVRHFNCWHPTAHTCAGSWQHRQCADASIKPLTLHDFAVIDTGSGSLDSLQCIWCGMFIEKPALAQHFAECHPDDVEVPKCNLCLQELILNARFQEKYSVDFEITLPDEHHVRCGACGTDFPSELPLDRHLYRRHIEGVSAENDQEMTDNPTSAEPGVNLYSEDVDDIGPEAFANSRMTLGKRRRPKRQFIMPSLRQAVPLDSIYVEPISECHWKCKTCEADIYGAVISAAAIRHFKVKHLELADNMQYELCKARLEKVSDGVMEFMHPQLIECLLCQQTFNLHQPFNICRAIRHLKSKHPNLMPEYAGVSGLESTPRINYADQSDVSISSALLIDSKQSPPTLYFAPDGSNPSGGKLYYKNVPTQSNVGHQMASSSSRMKLPRLDHTAAALPPPLTVEMVDSSTDQLGRGGTPVYILVADEVQQQQIVQQVMAAQQMGNV